MFNDNEILLQLFRQRKLRGGPSRRSRNISNYFMQALYDNALGGFAK